MHTRYRHSRSLFPVAVLLTMALTLTACGPDTSAPSAAATPSNPTGSDVVGAPSGAASAVAGTQTETGWGRIWDAVPPDFPIFPGSTIADPVSPDAVSATYAVDGGDPGEIMTWMQAGLETAGFATESLSGPLESGSFILESVGEGDCQIETTVAPMGSLAIISVRYGAGCPAA